MSSPLDFEIPGYDIIESIGRGGMASVYRARQHTFDRNVALKILKPDLSEDDAFCQRFIMESMIVAKLSHSHIVQVYDVGEISNHYYIAMEFLSGGDLSARLKKGMSAKEAIHVIKQIASALDFAHRKNIIHRDLKPDNVMFREDEAAVLTDFGIAKEISADINLTQTGLIVGTPKYMSPEQIRGADPTPQGDIYSLGIMFFQLLCNRVPFHGPDLVATAYKHFHDPVPQLPSHLAPFQSLLEQMLAKNVEDRISRGNDVVAAIEKIERSHPSFEAPSDDETIVLQLENSEENPTVVKVTPEARTEASPAPDESNKSNQKTTIVSTSPESQKVPLASSAETIVASTTDETQLKPRTTSASEGQSSNINSSDNKSSLPSGKASTQDGTPTPDITPPNTKSKIIGGVAAASVLLAAIGIGLSQSGPDDHIDGKKPTEENIANNSTSNVESQQEKHKQKIDDLIASAANAFKNDPLATHQASAFALYKQVLALSPNDPRALEALRDIAQKHLSAAKKSIAENNLDAAKKSLAYAKAADASADIATLETEIQNATPVSATLTAKQSFQVSALLQEAKYYEEQGAIRSPRGGNAVETYKKVLAIDPQNAKAKARLASLEKP